jgi:hypothetical protein
VEVIEHQVNKRWCLHCAGRRNPKLDLSGQVIGVRVPSRVSHLRTTLRLPFRLIRSYLATPHRMQLSLGEIVELTHDVRQQLQPQGDQLKAEVQASTVSHSDETSWRENG